MKIVNTDNFGSDYPNETFVNLPMWDKERMTKICKVINECAGENCPRYWKVVENDYVLQPGFEP